MASNSITQHDKTDWLTDMYRQRRDVLLSDEDIFSKVLRLPIQGCASIRYIANARLAPTWLLVAKPADGDLRFLERYSKRMEILNEWGRRYFNAEFAVISTHATLSADPNQAEFGLYDRATGKTRMVATDGLAKFFEGMNPAFTDSVGTTKELNSKLADDFQAFTRAHLSKFISVADLDGLVFEGADPAKMRILELRRPEKYLKDEWRPFLKDMGGLSTMMDVSNRLGLRAPIVVAYNPFEANQEVAVHHLHTLDRKAKTLQGEFQVMDAATALQGLAPGEGTRYTVNPECALDDYGYAKTVRDARSSETRAILAAYAAQAPARGAGAVPTPLPGPDAVMPPTPVKAAPHPR